MARSSSSSSSSWLAITTLTILCITAAVIVNNNSTNNKSTTTSNRLISKTQITPQTKSSRGKISFNSKTRNMVGGYDNADAQLLQSEEVATVANFALTEHAAGKSSFLPFEDSSLSLVAVLPEELESGVVQMKVLEAQRQVVAGMNYKLTIAIFNPISAKEHLKSQSIAVLPEEVESGVVQMKVLEAQRQVVAGMNYKLTIAIFESNICQGAFKVTVYKPLPHMEQGLTVTSWGSVLLCSEITELLQDAMAREEGEAMAVETQRRGGKGQDS
eukprot:CAMPEP_0201681766 /NCGR_PEP_ID=MMETSP0494-20130426/51279_1 /ASSEMBLY_ACC=CAM_ASM_000839 /TAXON_ID=420259 /ORGANISM="Thalassiosira gravida, Strain GMp14c1" /LENGTH=271 /DNA_ID=CAMNT_0048165519 /DNA_START=232 /DNA_END=1044 /DNA_ORIENTATION=+